MHSAHTRREIGRQNSLASSDLQDDVAYSQLRLTSNHVQDVWIAQEVLSQLSAAPTGPACRLVPSGCVPFGCALRGATRTGGLVPRMGGPAPRMGAHHPKTRSALRSTVASSSAMDTPRNSAMNSAVCATKDGWLRCLRTA